MKITISALKSSRFKALLGVIPGVILWAGCFTGLEAPRSGEETGLVRVLVGGNQRTLLPDLPELTSLYYTLALRADGQKDVSASIPQGEASADVELTSGTWTVAAKGFVSQEDAEDETKALVQGGASVTVTAGNSVSLPIPLSVSKTQKGTGTLHYATRNIQDLNLDAANLSIIPLSDGATAALSIQLLEAGKGSGDISLNAGYYRLSISLSKYSQDSNASIRAGKTEVVHIYDALTTQWEDGLDTYPFYTLPTFENTTDLLTAIDGATATEANPYHVALRGSYTEAELNTLFTEIQQKSTYSTLDLSDCEIETITNTLTNPQYVVSLILPRTLKTLGASNHTTSTSVFKGWTTLKSAAFPPGSALETLGKYAFYQCTALMSADLSGCTALKSTTYTFYDCTALQEVKLPESLETLGDYTFRGCSALDSVNMPVSLKAIGNFAFQNCQILPSVKLPVSLKSIGNSAFQGCQAFTSVTLPASLKTIGNNAFGNSTQTNACTNLDVDFSQCRSLTSIGSSAFKYCAITSVDLSGCIRLVSIAGSDAFGNCTNLTSVTLPEFLDSIAASTFKNCSSLTRCVVYAVDPPTLATDALLNTSPDLQIHVPAASVAAYQGAANWSSLVDKIIPIGE
ncbi:MAG: leucine-rich repeat domain-containing protein [Treponema sp.]|jgi:hypothetical protein|nr:leucine-rich repeat domain-containing protein [Treponema sp.]